MILGLPFSIIGFPVKGTIGFLNGVSVVSPRFSQECRQLLHVASALRGLHDLTEGSLSEVAACSSSLVPRAALPNGGDEEMKRARAG